MDNPALAEVLAYIETQYGIEPEYLWARNPEYAAIRHTGSKKWFAALLPSVPRERLGLCGDGCVDIINVKCEPLMIGSFLDGKSFLPGYHMNKEHWLSIVLDGSVPTEEMHFLIDMSFSLTKGKK